MKGGTVEASKFTALTKLYAIRDNGYRGYHNKSGEVKDYDKESVDKLIWAKESKQADKNNKKELNDQDLYANYLKATPLNKMSVQEYEDFYFLENGKLPWSSDCDEGFKKAVLSLAVQRASGTDKTPKKRAAIKKAPTKKPTKKKAPKKQLKPEPSITMTNIKTKIKEMHQLKKDQKFRESFALRQEVEAFLRDEIDCCWNSIQIWGPTLPSLVERIEELHSIFELFGQCKISKFKNPEDNDIRLFLSKDHVERDNITDPLMWARQIASDHVGGHMKWQPTDFGEELFEARGKSKMPKYYLYTEFMGDKMLLLETNITEKEYRELFI